MKLLFFIIFLILFIPTFSNSFSQSGTVIENVETYVENQNIETQNVGSKGNNDIGDLVFEEVIAIISSIIGVSMTALFAWLRKKGIPVTTEQEKAFKQIVTQRFEKLAKQSWSDIRANPDKFDEYWNNYLSKGKIPQEFVDRLKKEGKDFAVELKHNREFRDFAKNLTDTAMEKLLANLRNNLKANYQQRMIDVLPKLASIAVDAAFDKNVTDVDTWANKSLENLKPLLVSSEALDTVENLKIIVKSEINKRIQLQSLPR